MAASIRKFDDIHVGKHEVIEAKPNRDPIADAEQDLLEGAAEERAKAKEHNRLADDYERRAKLLRQTFPLEASSGPQSSRRVSDWSNTDPADAMHDYMRLIPKGHHLKIAQVVEALTQGNCQIVGKLRPGDKSYQKAAERKLLITASAGHNREKYAYDKKTREIWRI